MLPATVQFVIAMIASALTDRLTKKMDYMREEQRILLELLHQATGKKRIAFTADHRRRLALKGKELTAKERKACCHIVRPEINPRVVSAAQCAQIRRLTHARRGSPAKA